MIDVVGGRGEVMEDVASDGCCKVTTRSLKADRKVRLCVVL